MFRTLYWLAAMSLPTVALPQQRYLSSFAYTIRPGKADYSQMWTADDFIFRETSGRQRPWQNLLLVTGNDTTFAELSAEILRRTSHNVPILWYWGGWRTDLPGAAPLYASWSQFQHRYGQLREMYTHLPTLPWGLYLGDEPDLARHPQRQALLHTGLEVIKSTFPNATTYLNMLYGSIGCPGPNPGGPSLCPNRSTWPGDPIQLATALGKMQIDWLSTDEYYDVTIPQYRHTYETKLYPYLRAEQRIVLLPFAAYCEIGCPHNISIAGPASSPKFHADKVCLAKAQQHLRWAQSDPRVVGLFIYRLKNLWQTSAMDNLDACYNPSGTGLGLVDRCGQGGKGGYATPATLEFYVRNVSKALASY